MVMTKEKTMPPGFPGNQVHHPMVSTEKTVWPSRPARFTMPAITGWVLFIMLLMPGILFSAVPDMPRNLRVESCVDPLGIDNPRPRFGWILQDPDRGEVQSAYQLIVASSSSGITEDNGDLWDSGKVASHRQNAVTYSGRPLQSQTPYGWKVRVWDREGNVSPRSAPATFETALLEASDWTAHWMGGDFNRYRREFKLPSGTITSLKIRCFGQDFTGTVYVDNLVLASANDGATTPAVDNEHPE